MKIRGVGLMAVVAVSLALAGCGSKTGTTGGAGDPTAAPGMSMPPGVALDWGYDVAPTPPFQGTPDVRLTSFGFDQASDQMRPEGIGACREAVKKIKDRPDAKLVVIGFADGITEKDRAEALGTQRAESVRGFLSTLGIDAGRVQVASYGARYSTARDFEKIKQGHERKAEIWLLK